MIATLYRGPVLIRVENNFQFINMKGNLDGGPVLMEAENKFQLENLRENLDVVMIATLYGGPVLMMVENKFQLIPTSEFEGQFKVMIYDSKWIIINNMIMNIANNLPHTHCNDCNNVVMK